ncbi:MAG: S1 family peptidase [Luminiphilus sp.]|nr:S1 family peptidase [Luminiphilus sp.]
MQVPMYRFEGYERRHFIEYCSAFLLAPKIGAKQLISAWHCVDGWRPTWAPIRVYLDEGVVEGRVQNTGGSMQNDWLIIGLTDVALPENNAIAVASASPRQGERLIAVGFGPKDLRGQRYQRSVQCRVESVTATINADCQMMKGDSGGLLARQTNDGLEALGIVSSKSPSGTTQFTPIAKVLSSLDR